MTAEFFHKLFSASAMLKRPDLSRMKYEASRVAFDLVARDKTFGVSPILNSSELIALSANQEEHILDSMERNNVLVPLCVFYELPYLGPDFYLEYLCRKHYRFNKEQLGVRYLPERFQGKYKQSLKKCHHVNPLLQMLRQCVLFHRRLDKYHEEHPQVVRIK